MMYLKTIVKVLASIENVPATRTTRPNDMHADHTPREVKISLSEQKEQAI